MKNESQFLAELNPSINFGHQKIMALMRTKLEKAAVIGDRQLIMGGSYLRPTETAK